MIIIINVFSLFFHCSGVVTMSADSTATSDASDPGSPFSHTSASTCTEEKITSTTSPQQQQQQQKTLKRQAQVTEKCDKKRVKKELCSKNNNVEIKLIPLNAPITANGNAQANAKKSANSNNTPKSILSPITNNSLKKTAIINPPPPIVIPTPPTSLQPPPNLAALTSTPIGVSAISKLTDYYKLKKDPAKLNEVCNMLLSLQSGAKQQNNSKVAKASLPPASIAATTITPVSQQQQQLKTNPIKPIASGNKKVTNEKKTAKIAPIIPVARKNTTTQSTLVQQPVKISPKKPVSIAPRIVDTKNALLQPKPSSLSLVNGKTAPSNGKLIAANNTTSNSQQNTNQQQQQQQPTVLLAAIRIPNQMQPSTQPPPLKIQNGLIQKTTTTTTTTTKLAPLLQFHTQPMIPNLIQFQPNLIAAANKQNALAKSNNSTTNAAQAPNLIVNNGQLTHQQQQQLFMNGAVIKLQPMSTQAQQQPQNSTVTSSTTAAMSATQKFAIQQQQQAFTAQLTAQHMQQLFMTTPVLFNTSSIPTVLTSQLAGLQAAFNQHQAASSLAPPSSIPALQPIQSSILSSSSFASSSLTSTTNSMQLPAFSTLLHNQQLQNIQIQQQPMMKQFATSLPPSLTITSGFVPHSAHQLTAKVNVPPQATIAPSQKVPPPLAPASNHPINLPKLISVTSSASQTSPKSSPPPLVINQKVSLPQGSPVVSKTPSYSVKQENAICVVPPLPSPAKLQLPQRPQTPVTITNNADNLKVEVETEETITITETKDSTKSAISVVVEEKASIECAKSPILSQPKTIRFPPVNGKVTVWKKCVKISKTGVCNWEKCSKHFDSNADLLEHLHRDHVNEQGGPFVCSWKDCKVNGREGSKGWLERHVMSHVGSKPFKCIVERCGLRFSTQVSHSKTI